MPSFTIGGSSAPTLANQSGGTLNINNTTSNSDDTITLITTSGGDVRVNSGGYYQ